MINHLTEELRSWNMQQIRSKDTKPEIKVRKLLFSLGYRFRLHRKDLPGTPDIVLKKYKSVILVHGCFWHMHNNCRRANLPKSNLNYWEPKLTKNKERDERNISKLRRLGWKVLRIWECDVDRNPEKVIIKIKKFLNNK